MPIKISPRKIYTVPYQDREDPSISFSITFKFPYTKDASLDVEKNENPLAYIIRIMHSSIIKTEGIIDEDTGEEIVLNDDSRSFICDMVQTMPEYLYSIAAAFMGPKGKNWLTGVMALLTTDGHPENVNHASLTVQESVS